MTVEPVDDGRWVDGEDGKEASVNVNVANARERKKMGLNDFVVFVDDENNGIDFEFLLDEEERKRRLVGRDDDLVDHGIDDDRLILDRAHWLAHWIVFIF